ncbi:ribonuclease CAF1 [Martensiomyces pterosporus]|nr:ribonuclease CAF1 [Martensiomyces pterosporus]
MDVTRDNFPQALAEFEQAIAACDFVAIDMEMTGLYEDRASHPNRLDTKDERYQKLKKSVESYGVTQVGICLFSWTDAADSDPDFGQVEHGYYEARPFNFNVFPCTNVNGVPVEVHFGCKNTAFDFLARNSFDFNKWIYQGIPYLRSEEAIRVKKEKMDLIKNRRQAMVDVGEKNRQFVEEFELALRKFVRSNSTQMKYSTSNSFERKLIYQKVSEYDSLGTTGRAGFIEVFKSTKKAIARQQDRKIETLNKCIKEATGFCAVIDLLSAAKKPVVGHNMPLDILHAYSKFYKPLPATRAEFEAAVGKFLPVLIDTKYIIESTPAIKAKYRTSNLDEIAPILESESRTAHPLIRNHPRFTRDMTRNMHEAGFDAYMTGATFIRLLNLGGGLRLNGSGRATEVEHSSELVLYRYINRLYLASSDDIFWPITADARPARALGAPPNPGEAITTKHLMNGISADFSTSSF